MRRPLIAVVSIIVLITAVQRFQDVIPNGDTGNKDRVMIVHESSQDDPAQGDVYVALRDGEVAKYLNTKGSTLDVLDVDTPDEHDRQLAKEMLGDTTPPAILFRSKKGTVSDRQSLGKRFTEQSILKLIKKHGI